MLEIVNKSYKEEHQKGGRKDGATPRERLEITLKYLRQYLSQRYLAKEYNIGKSRIAPIINSTRFVKGSVHDFKLFKESTCDYNTTRLKGKKVNKKKEYRKNDK